MDFAVLSATCAPLVDVQTMQALVQVESGFNPFAIGVVNGRLERQPINKAEAVATARELERQDFNYSVGIAQVNKHNFKKYGLTVESAFDACQSLRAGSQILASCFKNAHARYPAEQQALQAALSCYYSGNFQTGFRPDFKGQPSYVQKVLNAAASGKRAMPIPVTRDRAASFAARQPSTTVEAADARKRLQAQAQENKAQSALVF